MAQAAIEICDICVSAPAENFCVDCKQRFCNMCKGLHSRQNSTRNHIFQQLQATCKEHVQEFLLLCTDCDELVCNCCIEEKHNGHKLCDIDGQIKNKKEHEQTETPADIQHQKNQVLTEQPATIVSASEEGMRHLRNIFEQLEQFLEMEEFDQELQDELSTACPNYMTVLSTAKRDLLTSDCGIVIAGATSAGKTSLVNLIIEKEKEKLFVPRNLASTGAICRIRNSETMKIQVFTKDGVPRKEVIVDDLKQLKSNIMRFTDIKKLQNEIPDAYYVDIFLPVSILKGNVIIVDTPGIGETTNLDKILLDFLPHAVSFIFIVNARDAGGIHEDRLLKILKTIIENQDKMPCFDPRDTMFLTNQWDIVENDSGEDEEETELERTWMNIKCKLEKGWGSITSNNLFRVSLKQVANQMQTEFTEDYGRFKQVLKETINKNQNKRMKFYYSFLETFTQNAERGTLARLKLLKRSEEEQQAIVRKNREIISSLIKDCSQAKRILEEYRREMIFQLTNKLVNYLSSSQGKYQILNPQGSSQISLVSYHLLNDEIPRRVESGIKRWCEGREVKLIMEDADAKIRSLLKDIEVQLENVEMDLTGFNLRYNMYNPYILMIGIRLYTLSLRVVVALFIPVLLGRFPWTELLLQGGLHEIMVNKYYEKCLQYLHRKALTELFENSFGANYSTVIDRIFVETIPRKLCSLQKLNERLSADYKEIRQKRKSFERLKHQIELLSRESDLFKQTCAGLFNIKLKECEMGSAEVD